MTSLLSYTAVTTLTVEKLLSCSYKVSESTTRLINATNSQSTKIGFLNTIPWSPNIKSNGPFTTTTSLSIAYLTASLT